MRRTYVPTTVEEDARRTAQSHNYDEQIFTINALAGGVGEGSGTGVAQYYLMAGAIAGSPPASLSIGFYVVVLTFTLPAGLTGSQGYCKTPATGSPGCNILVNNVVQGTMNFPAGAHVATFTFASPVVMHPGDRLEVLSPGTVDTTLADWTWTLMGNV